MDWDDGLSCGHQWKYLKEEHTCCDCAGKGKVIHRVSLQYALDKLEHQTNEMNEVNEANDGKKQYALSMVCINHDGRTEHQVATVWAHSRDEAVRIGRWSIKSYFPPEKGYYDYSILAIEVQ